MSYDPRQRGARCDLCPLRTERAGGPVPGRWPDNPRALIVGEAPGETECKKGEPFVGKAGAELKGALSSVGAPIRDIALANTIECRPPENELDRFLKDLDRENKRRAKEAAKNGEETPEPLPTPMECCRPRLLADLAACTNVIPVGGIALHAIAGGTAGILSARGSPITVSTEAMTLRVLPTLHPSFVMRSRRWRGAFRADLARAFRWFSTGLDWTDPKAMYIPTPAQLARFLEWLSSQPFSVFDVETCPGFPTADHFDAIHDRLRCIGIGTSTRGVVIPFRSVSGEGTFYHGRDQSEIVRLLRDYLSSPRWRKVGWNSRVYDRMVVEARLGVVPSPHLDALGLHRLAEPELPHDLGYAGSIFTDVDDWKAGHTATTAQTDEALWAYNIKDLAVTAMCVAPLKKACEQRKQIHLLPFFARLQDVCVELHKNGMLVDQSKRREWDRKLVAQASLARRKLRDLSGLPNLNPGSVPQLRDLLFERLHIAPHHYTESGDPSTDDDALRAFMSSGWSVRPQAKAIVSTLRDFRRYAKRRGAVVRLRPITEAYYEAPELTIFDESKEEREERLKRIERGKSGRACGLTLPDGRVHANFLAQGTVGWRLSSNTPNMQNWESKLRDMFIAAPGHVFVACDEAQLELRMVVGLAKTPYYLERFDANEDPHATLCEDVFGDTYRNASKDGKKKLRVCVKGLTYASLYGADDETKHEIITSAEDSETESLLFPDFSIREVQAFSRAWHARCPEIAKWWEETISEWQRQGYLAEPILGLKCDFLDGEDPNKLYNYKAQSGGAALAHMALFRALERLPREAPSARLVQQGHDSIVFECLETESKSVARILEESMAEDGNKFGMPVRFLGETKIGKTWKDV